MAEMRKKATGTKAASDPVAAQLTQHAQAHWPQCQRVVVQNRGGAVYVAAKVKGEREPVPLCRLRGGSMGLWDFGFYSAARDKYEASLLPSGKPFGTLEECFDCAAALYLQF
jgi:hypothetical protein